MKKYVLSLSYSYRCVEYTGSDYTIDQINQMSVDLYSYDGTNVSISYIDGAEFLDLLDLRNLSDVYAEQIRTGAIRITN